MVEVESMEVRFWLASASERRLDWIEKNYQALDVEITAIPLVENDEPVYNSIPVSEQVNLIAESKLRSAYIEIQLGRLEQICNGDYESSKSAITIVSDTLVESPDDPNVSLGKPQDPLIATSMLMLLSGSRHNVWSATGLIMPTHSKLPENISARKIELGGGFMGYLFVESATIEIPQLSDDILSDLIKSKSWEGKAGAYDLAGKMGDYAKIISGEEVCVLGLASSAMNFLTYSIKGEL